MKCDRYIKKCADNKKRKKKRYIKKWIVSIYIL